VKKITYIISDIDKALAFEWVAMGLKEKFDLSFILIGKAESKFSFFLKEHSIRYCEINDQEFPSRIQKWIQLFWILKREKPNIVHTHLWNANLLGLSSAWVLGIKQRIYTRHHATTHYREFPSGRKWDVLCNTLATHIVAISKNVEEILIEWDKADAKKIRLIHHGFDLTYFKSITPTRVEALRTKYALTKNTSPVIGVISRYMQWKGIQYILPAFKKIREEYPNAKLVLANAHGNYASIIKKSLQSLPVGSFIEIKFEEDLAALYRIFDVFVHVPIDAHAEAFGQTYVEALVTRTPSVFTLSGIAREYIVHKQNAWVVDFQNSDQIVEGINALLNDKTLREQLKQQGEGSVQQFSLEGYILALEKLYTD
jgi:glycosyltransferase involved in cell wall biosynthesis